MEQTRNESRIMGIDYGEKRVGIALSDPLFIFAYPLSTLQNSINIVSDIVKIINEKNVIKVILGLPSSKFISSEKLSEKVIKLKNEIEIKSGIEVILWDEEFSSMIAKEKVNEAVTKKSKRRNKELLDQHSAAIILQEYLNSNQ